MTNTKDTVYKIVSIAALSAVMITIFCLSHENATDSKETSIAVTSWLNKIFGNIPDGVVRSVAHGCEYAALGFLMYNAFYSFKKKISPIISVSLSFLYAITDEIHQLFVPGRAFQLVDLIVDLVGILFGTVAIVVLIRLTAKAKNKSCDSN